MNTARKLILIGAVIWVFVLVGYMSTNPDNVKITPNAQDSSFSQLSHIATGYLNETTKTLKTTMPRLP